MGILTKIFGTKSDREIKKILPIVKQVNEFYATLEGKDLSYLQDRTKELQIVTKESIAEQESKKLLLELSSYCEKLGTTKPKTYLKKGNTSDELIKLINTEKRITVLVLGASIETGNPGPLINFVMNASFESRIPITIVPGNLTDEQIDDLI